MPRIMHRMRRTSEISASKAASTRPARAAPAQEPAKKLPFIIEDIDALRLGAGIEDRALALAIRHLVSGDVVKLTFLRNPEAKPGETLSVRVSGRKGLTFTGTLAGRPRSAGLSKLHIGVILKFTAAHIHSIVKPCSPSI